MKLALAVLAYLAAVGVVFYAATRAADGLDIDWDDE